jgi:hypothetical protein
MRNRLKSAVRQLRQLLPTSKAEKAKHLLAPVAVVAAHENARQALAFGLLWQSIVDDKSRLNALKTARQRGATHTTHQGLQTGFARVLPGDIRPGEKLYAASRIAARKFGGDALFVLVLAPDLHWLAVVRNGQPSAQDRIYATADEACEEARRIFESLHNDGVYLKVYSDAPDLGLSSAVLFDQLALMQAVDSSSESLVAIKAPQSPLPMPAVVGLCVVAVGLAGYKGYQIHRAKKRAEAIARANAAEGNAVAAWDKAVADWAATVAGAGGTGIGKAREALGRAPAVWDGWLLDQAGCVAAPPAPAAAPGGVATRVWSCDARYTRGRAAALTCDLQASAPTGWRMNYPNLSTALASWTLSEDVKALDPAQLRTVAHHQVETASLLQPLRPALSEDIAFVFEPVAVPPPVDSKGAAIPLPSETPAFRRMGLRIKGPLRSLDAVFASPTEVDWNELRLTSVQAYPDAPIDSGLTTSAVLAEAKGTLHAKQ